MKRFSAILVILAAAAAASACGSGSSATTHSSAAAPQTSTPSSAGSASTSTGATGNPAATARRLGKRAQDVLAQMARATGQLATGNSSSEQRARSKLAQAQTKAHQLSATASAKLPGSNPARPLIVDTTRQAAVTAGQLRTMKLTTQDRQTLKKAQAGLSTLAGEVGLMRLAPQQATVTQITSTLKSLARAAGGTGGSH